MKRIAIIACDNGLGHVRRCYLIGLELAYRGILVDLFAPKQSFERFKELFEPHASLQNIEFSIGISTERLIQSDPFTLNWHERLPDMSAYDVVVSDNLPEILHVRPDAYLSGHFFWHDALDGLSEEYRRTSQTLIMRHNPVVIATELFASEAVRACPRYTPVGLYVYGGPSFDALNGDALLITGGSTPVLRAGLLKFIHDVVQYGPGTFKVVYIDSDLALSIDKGFGAAGRPVDSEYGSRELPDWIELATYDVAMYKRVTAAICRPGIGTITDLLQHGGRAFCVYEQGNREVAENARRLEERGLGISIGDPRRLDILKAILKKTGEQERITFVSALKLLGYDGSVQTAQVFLGREIVADVLA